MTHAIRPIPLKHGIGFTTDENLPADLVERYRHEQSGRHHNYHVTADRWEWPVQYETYESGYVIDAFSPNLNKSLHVGHMRNLAIASCLSRVLGEARNAKFVALLGTSLGVISKALTEWNHWTKRTGYEPKVYYDCALPQDVVDEHPEKEKAGPLQPEIDKMDLKYSFWTNSKDEEILIRRSDGSPLYAFHDLAFAEWVGPTHYITGQEQRDHFKSLDLEDKHLPMGLVLGSDGKKLKSRDGSALPLKEAVNMVVECLRETPEPSNLAWNVLVWNMLQPNRERDVKFEVEKWIRPESPGMYITYTYSRVKSALAEGMRGGCRLGKYLPVITGTGPDHQMEEQELSELDLRLLGLSEQYNYYRQLTVDKFDPSPIANFAHTLARELSSAYEKEQIRKGRPSFVAAISHALWRLDCCMSDLGMFRLSKV